MGRHYPAVKHPWRIRRRVRGRYGVWRARLEQGLQGVPTHVRWEHDAGRASHALGLLIPFSSTAHAVRVLLSRINRAPPVTRAPMRALDALAT